MRPQRGHQEQWVLGFGGSDHDFAAALMRGTDIQIAIESERLTRVKYGIPAWHEDPLTPCADHCLSAAGISRSDVARVVSSDFLPYRTREAWSIETYGHHLAHAASAVMLLPPSTTACVVVFDGAGSMTPANAASRHPQADYETISFFEYAGGRLDLLGQTRGRRYLEPLNLLDGGTDSLGQLYELITTMIGFERKESGKTMGLAGWGEPRHVDELMRFVRFGSTFEDVFRFDPFEAELHATLGRLLQDGRQSFAARADLAATVQELFTQGLLRCYELLEHRAFEVLAFAGGCALNTVANGVLAKRLPAGRRLLVPPHAGDAGIALGSLWLDARRHQSGAPELTLRGQPLHPGIARPGRTYPPSEVARAEGGALPRAARDPAVDGPEALARVLASGAIIGVFNGASEVGPRALGGRSILADPRTARLKERINREIKHREPFRPLAPMVLAERFDQYFSPPAAADPFMLVVADALPECRQAAPAVVHVDGTARVQVVGPDGDPFLVRLLEAFEALTGLGILLNTSFNRRGEPIVETPADAVAAFADMGLDGLWLDGRFLYPAP